MLNKSDTSCAVTCSCKKEVDLLKDTVVSLQADILQMKQKKGAEDIAHLSETQTLHSAITEIKNELSNIVSKSPQCLMNA